MMQLCGESLLELCAGKLHCYISDLAFPILKNNIQMKKALLPILAEICPEQADLHEWNESILYILGDDKVFQDAQVAKDYLIKQLGKEKSR